MADRTIGDLPAASQLLTADLIPIEQGGNAKKITGNMLAQYAREKGREAASQYAALAAASASDAANSAAEAAAWSEHPPYIGANGNWWIYNTTTKQFVDSGVDASIAIQIADITEVAVGTSPYVTNTGTNTEPIFHLFIPAAKGIQSIAKSGTSGNVDTYTVTFNDTTTFQFTVTNGEDGVSPVVSVSTITGGHEITVTDAAHPSGQSFSVMNGNDGISPSVTVTAITGGHRVSVTDASGTQTFDVLDGSGAGDMVSTTYDPNGNVASAGGIPDYVEAQVPTAAEKAAWNAKADTSDIPEGATATPLMDGTAAVGLSNKWAKEDHIHPHDTSKQDTLMFDTTPTVNSTNPVMSGGVYAEMVAKAPLANNAGAHNSIYRGKYLGNTVTAAQYSSINAGTFDDIFIGDYWTINGVNWRVAALDYYLHYGDTQCTKHHVVVVPDTNLVNALINSTNIVTGAYVGSDYYTGANGNTGREDAGAIIKAAFGNDHILAHRILLQNTVPEGKGYTGVWGGWYDAHPADLMSEEMVYGCKEFKNETAGENLAGNYTVDHGQLPLFRRDHSRICNRATWWLREVASPTYFSRVSANGYCTCADASNAGGVRPASAICA